MVHKDCNSPPRSLVGASSLRYISLAVGLVERSLIAIIAAYLIYWPISYLISHKVFKLDIKWTATLASGVSICGVSAAIATAAAIGAPIYSASHYCLNNSTIRSGGTGDTAIRGCYVPKVGTICGRCLDGPIR